MSGVGRLLTAIAPIVFDVIVFPFGNCTFIGCSEVVNCKLEASERLRRVCVDPESIQNCPEKATVLKANAVLVTTGKCKQGSKLFRDSCHIFVKEPRGHVVCDVALR